MDGFSEVPDEIIHHILSFLPMKDAVATSILSKRWIHQWCFNSVFYFPVIPLNCSAFAIHQCLERLRSVGQLQTLEIDASLRESKVTKTKCMYFIKQWIYLSAKRQVRDLTISIDDVFFTTPIPLFSIQTLNQLDLTKTIFTPPLDFKGFPFLKSLFLFKVVIPEPESFSSFLSACPCIETLHLLFSKYIKYLQLFSESLKEVLVAGVEELEVSGSSLQFLTCHGWISMIRVKNAPFLTDVRLSSLSSSLRDRSPKKVVGDWGSWIVNFSQVKCLSVNDHFIQVVYVAGFHLQRSYQSVFRNLKHLCLGTYYIRSYFSLVALVTFLGYCPSLEKIEVRLKSESTQHEWLPELMKTRQEESQIIDEEGRLHHELTDYNLHNLITVRLDGFSAQVQEMALVRFFIEKADALEDLIIGWNSEIQEKENVTAELSSSPRTSPCAKIFYKL